jgi:hypothetical protein
MRFKVKRLMIKRISTCRRVVGVYIYTQQFAQPAYLFNIGKECKNGDS